MPIPNFILFGSPKAGTTSVFEYLRTHPQIYMSCLKEPNFFYREGLPLAVFSPDKQNLIATMGLPLEGSYDFAFYQRLFEGATTESVIGEASVSYIYNSEAVIAGIKRHLPEVKLIALLRNPVERAYSHYLHSLMYQRETIRDFGKALAESADRDQYLLTYAEHLERYLNAFGPEQLRVYVYDDLRADPARFMHDIYSFLGVDAAFAPELEQRHNVTSYPKTNALGAFIKLTEPLKGSLKAALPARAQMFIYERLVLGLDRRFNQTAPPPLSNYDRSVLQRHFVSDIGRLEQLLGRDLSAWKV